MDRVGRAEYSPQFLTLVLGLSAITLYIVWHAAVQGELPLGVGGSKPVLPPTEGTQPPIAPPIEPQPEPDSGPSKPHSGTPNWWKDY